MPWCPGCSYEYDARKRKCPECGIELSKGPGFSTPLKLENHEWITVRTCTDNAMAESLRSFLETHGIDVNLRNANGSVKKKKQKNGTPEAVTLMLLVPLKKAARASKLIIHDTSWIDTETAEPPDQIALEEDDYEYIPDNFEGDEHSFIDHQMYSDSHDDFDDIY